MRSIDRRELLTGGAAFAACCFCRAAVAETTEKPPQSFEMIAYCCLDCGKCDAYRATVEKNDALRAEVAARWQMKPEQIECLGCKSKKALFNCTLKPCATKRGVPTCAHCPDFPSCQNEQWAKFPKLRETATAMRARLGL
jgi:hypothetical protein